MVCCYRAALVLGDAMRRYMDNLGICPARPSDLTVSCISACNQQAWGWVHGARTKPVPSTPKNRVMGCAEDVPRKEYTERSLEIPRKTFSLSATVLLCSGTLGYGNVPCARELITDVSPVRGAPCHGAPWKPPVGPSAPDRAIIEQAGGSWCRCFARRPGHFQVWVIVKHVLGRSRTCFHCNHRHFPTSTWPMKTRGAGCRSCE